MTAIAPTTSNHRKYRLPCLVILPSLSLPPVLCCLGTSPIQAARLRPDEGHDAPIDGRDLGPDSAMLPGQHLKDAADGRGNPTIRTIRNDPEQLSRSITALGRHNAEFGHVAA